MTKLFMEVDIRRDDVVRVRVTADEKALLEQKAMDTGLLVSEYVRRCALGRPIRSRAAATIINQLRDLADQQKEFFRHEAEYREILEGIVAAIERVTSPRILDL